jgi:hypothetical protein
LPRTNTEPNKLECFITVGFKAFPRTNTEPKILPRTNTLGPFVGYREKELL